MKTKLFVLLTVFTLVMGVSVLAAQPPVAKVRVVDTSALGVTQLDDAELARLAVLSAAENPRIFPFVSDFVLKSGSEAAIGSDATVKCVLSCPIDLSGSLKEDEKLEFVSIPSKDDVPKYDIAIVKPNGTVVKVDKEVIVDYQNRTLNTIEPITVGGGDVILTFVRDVKPIFFGHDRPTGDNKEKEPNDTPSTQEPPR